MLLDTHILIWLVLGNTRLQPWVHAAISSSSVAGSLYMSPISLWEIALKQSRGKLELGRPLRPWLRQALSMTGVQLIPMDIEIACACAELPATFHGDPADRMIAATARTHGLTLVTDDKKLLQLGRDGHLKTFKA
ncbi:MAG TPA: type II toxin-antitoxin system VapC family toxin [Acidobacteriaceae bacterium]|nr:type II toxin-antitoxin system VapC family toxin [Acidobacteriaceae bacterium]